MSAICQQNVRKLVQQGEDPPVGRISIVEKDYGQRAVRNASATHLIQLNITGLKYQYTVSLYCCSPSVQRGIWPRPTQLVFPRNPEQIANSLPYRFILFMWMSNRCADLNSVSQLLIHFSRSLAAKERHAQCQPKFRSFVLGR